VVLGKTLSKIMVRERPKVMQFATVYDATLGLYMRRYLGLPFIVYAHGNEILDVRRYSWAKSRLALRKADRVFAVSHRTAEFIRDVGVDPQRIDILHPGCDFDKFRPLPPRKELLRGFLGCNVDRKVILTVGGLVPRKGHDMVIRALPFVQKSVSNVVYLIVGTGPGQSQLEALSLSLWLTKHVIFVGKISDEELPWWYALSDVFAMPSRENLEKCDVEGFGLVFLEANACGKPVLGGLSGGIADAVIDGETGLLVNPTNPEEIAGGLIRLLSDSSFSTRLGQRGRRRVEREFSWTRVVEHVDRTVHAIGGDARKER